MQDQIRELADGKRTLQEIADACGCHRNTVWRIAKKLGLPVRPAHGFPLYGAKNPAWRGGVTLTRNGYRHVLSPHTPGARKDGYILEHRKVAQEKIGRPLRPNEIVHHIDGLCLHNAPENLSIMTTENHSRHHHHGAEKKWSKRGMERLSLSPSLRKDHPPVNIYQERLARGDVLLREILRLARELGIDSPHLWGSSEWLEKAGIPELTHSSLQRAWDDLSRRFEADLLRSE